MTAKKTVRDAIKVLNKLKADKEQEAKDPIFNQMEKAYCRGAISAYTCIIEFLEEK